MSSHTATHPELTGRSIVLFLFGVQKNAPWFPHRKYHDTAWRTAPYKRKDRNYHRKILVASAVGKAPDLGRCRNQAGAYPCADTAKQNQSPGGEKRRILGRLCRCCVPRTVPFQLRGQHETPYPCR